MKSNLFVLAMAFAMVCAARLSAEEAAKAEPMCPISGHAINKDVSADFEGGKIYFCCDGCPAGFAKDTEKFAAKARHQMCLTGQMEQVHCPIAHKDFKDDQSVDVGGVTVKFCCGGCKGKVAKMNADEQVAACFGKADCFKAASK